MARSNSPDIYDVTQRSPMGAWVTRDVVFSAPYADTVVPHPLKSTAVRFLVVDSTVPGMVFRGTKSATADYLVLQASAAGTYHLQLFIEVIQNQTDLITGPTTAGASSIPRNALPATIAYEDETNAFSLTQTFNGLVDVVNGQVKFPATQNPSSDVNTLDDYEEGTWTPTLIGSTSQSGQVYSIQQGYYIKLGKFVFCYCNVALSTVGTFTGIVELGGLPFTVDNLSQGFTFGSGQWNGLATNWVSMVVAPQPNTTTALMRGAKAANTNNTTDVLQGDLQSGSNFFWTFGYRASQ